MGTARRVYIYVMAFAGLVATLVGASGLLLIVAATVTLQGNALLAATATRSQVSLYLAALIVGLLIWPAHWLLAQRAAAGAEEEHASPQRRLYFAAVFAVTSIVALWALRGLLSFAFALPSGEAAANSQLSAINSGAKLLVYGVTWLAFARLAAVPADEGGTRDRPNDIQDVAVFALIAVALSLFLIGVVEALREILRDLLGPLNGAGQVLFAGPSGTPWVIWGSIAASLVSGSVFWTIAWQFDLVRGGVRRVRIWYLYLVLVIAVPTTLTSAVFLLYESLRRLLGYQPSGGAWSFVRDWLPLLLTGSLVWAHHWSVIRQQARYVGTGLAASRGIPWPRRPALALLTLLGIAAATPALISLLWLGLDFLLHSGASLSGPGWWRDRLSFGLAASLVGGAVWLGAWSVLEDTAASEPQVERFATARRLMLGIIVLAGALAATGFTIALLWLGIRAALGDNLSPGSVSLALKDLSAALITAALAVYHGRVIRRDATFGPGAPARQIRILALLAPDAEAALASLRERPDLQIEVIGRLSEDSRRPDLDLAALQLRISTLAGDGGTGRALLVLSPNGGSLYPYHR